MQLKWLKEAVERFRAVIFHVGLLAFCVCYVFCGALLFRAIERPHERELLYELERVLDAEAALFIQHASELRFEKQAETAESLVASLLDNYQRVILEQFENPVKENFFRSVYYNNRSYADLWTMPMALLFTTTSIVPVGFGFITPLTTTGRCLLVLYSIIGLPMALITLSDFGKFLCSLLHRSFKNVKATMFAMVGLLAAYPLLGAVLIRFGANLSWTESFYFCIASMFTIGFGDIFPEIPLGWFILFVVAGVLLVTAAVDLLASGVIHNIHYLGRRMFKAKRLAGKMFQLAAHQVSYDMGLVGSGLSQLNSFARANATSLLRMRGGVVSERLAAETARHVHLQRQSAVVDNDAGVIYRQWSFEPAIDLQFVDVDGVDSNNRLYEMT